MNQEGGRREKTDSQGGREREEKGEKKREKRVRQPDKEK